MFIVTNDRCPSWMLTIIRHQFVITAHQPFLQTSAGAHQRPLRQDLLGIWDFQGADLIQFVRRDFGFSNEQDIPCTDQEINQPSSPLQSKDNCMHMAHSLDLFGEATLDLKCWVPRCCLWNFPCYHWKCCWSEGGNGERQQPSGHARVSEERLRNGILMIGLKTICAAVQQSDYLHVIYRVNLPNTVVVRYRLVVAYVYHTTLLTTWPVLLISE